MALSRSGRTSPRGKLDAVISPIRVDEETHAIIRKLAAEQGLNPSEWVRELVMVRCYGVDALLASQRDRLMSVAGMSQESDAKGRK